ncbi:MAG: PilZ domain-containing protein [Planctomycetota bacterium JB042]
MSERVQNRRGKPRVDTNLPAKVTAADGGFEATVKNMSMSGLLLTSNRPIPEMTILGMRLSLPARPDRRSPAYAFELTGAVVRSEPCREEPDQYEIAVFLTDMARESRSALQSFIEERLAGID